MIIYKNKLYVFMLMATGLFNSGCASYTHPNYNVDMGFVNTKASRNGLVIINEPKITLNTSTCYLSPDAYKPIFIEIKGEVPFKVNNPVMVSGTTELPPSRIFPIDDKNAPYVESLVFQISCGDLNTQFFQVESIEVQGKPYNIPRIGFKTSRGQDTHGTVTILDVVNAH